MHHWFRRAGAAMLIIACLTVSGCDTQTEEYQLGEREQAAREGCRQITRPYGETMAGARLQASAWLDDTYGRSTEHPPRADRSLCSGDDS